jgi:hypothetical protein
MTITQTVEIPADHRVIFEVPREVPAGPALVTFTPVEQKALKTLPKGQKIKLTKQMVEELLNGEVLRSLTGILHTETSADEIRAERLSKHDHTD